MQPQAHRRLPVLERLSRKADQAPRLPRDVQPRPNQTRLLLDQGAEPEPHRAARARAAVGGSSTSGVEGAPVIWIVVVLAALALVAWTAALLASRSRGFVRVLAQVVAVVIG